MAWRFYGGLWRFEYSDILRYGGFMAVYGGLIFIILHIFHVPIFRSLYPLIARPYRVAVEVIKTREKKAIFCIG